MRSGNSYPLLYVCERCDHAIRTPQGQAVQHRRAVSAHSYWHQQSKTETTLREAEEELWND